MTYEEYAYRQALIMAALVATLIPILLLYQAVRLTKLQWFGMLSIIYPIVESARYESASLARDYYDSERQRRIGVTDEPFDIDLAPYRPEWFEEAISYTFTDFAKSNAKDSALAKVISVAGKEVENGGRRTVIRAVDNDPRVKGWARVQGGRESCAFCAMLISRGPVYLEAETAGLNLDEVTAVELWKQIEEAGTDEDEAEAQAAYDAMMTRWHPNCDCKVVPVFDTRSWPGRDDYLRSLELWKKASSDGRKGRDALNALRRDLESGDDEDEGGQVIPFPIAA